MLVIGEQWATAEAREQAQARQVDWKVDADISEGFLTFSPTISKHLPGNKIAGLLLVMPHFLFRVHPAIFCSRS